MRAAFSETFDVSDGEDADPLHGFDVSEALAARSGARRTTGRSGQIGAAGRGQVLDEPLLLLQLSAHQRARRRPAGRSRRRRRRPPGAVPPSSRALALLREDRARLARGRRRRRRARAADPRHTLRKRPLPRRDLEHRGAVPRAPGRPDRQRGAHRRDEHEGRDDRDDRPPGPRRKRLEAPREAHAQVTTSCACMPPMKWPAMLQNTS